MDTITRLDLPDDILQLIIETFVFQSGVGDVLQLFTVSRCVKAWAEPHVYSRVTLKSSDQVLGFAAALRDELTFSRPARHVRLLWLFCTDYFVTQHLTGVPEQCPNLVHFAFDGKNAPFYNVSVNSNERFRLTRLSICSPSLLDNEVYSNWPLILWNRLTHLHIFGPGDINDSTLYESLLGRRIAQLTSLQCICIQLTYPSPESDLFNYTFFSEMALFYLYLKEGLIRDLFERLPNLRKVLIKANFTYPRFRLLWNDLVRNLKDEPRVVFELKALPDQDFYEGALPCSTLNMTAWHKLLKNALDEVDQVWKTGD